MTRPKPATEVGLERLYLSGYPRFMRVARAMLGDPELARDAVHDTFVRAVSGLDRFRGESRLETWVWQILTNACLTEQRREITVPSELDERAEPVAPDDWPEVRQAVADSRSDSAPSCSCATTPTSTTSRSPPPSA